MANRMQPEPGSWLRVEELIERGDPEFVSEFRRISDADRLGSFAKVFYSDKRTSSRKLLLEYLKSPLSSFRHEAFVKRLFKLAEAAQDDEVMAYFMVALDRSIRRIRRTRHRYDWSARESWTEETVVTPRMTTLPKKYNPFLARDRRSGEWIATPDREDLRRMALFSIATRKYLRRRVWRYFRKIAKSDDSRYVNGVRIALSLYTDRDCTDGLALLDNWSLVHALFGRSDVIVSKSRSWKLAEGRALSELKSAPAFSDAWQKNSEPLLSLLDDADCRPVRQWSMSLLREHHQDAIAKVSTDRLLRWVRSSDEELARFGAELLSKSNSLGTIRVSTWLQLIREANQEVMDVICKLIQQSLSADAVTLREAVALACSRNLSVAELGLAWVEARAPQTETDYADLLLAMDAQNEYLRPKLVEVVRRKLDGVQGKYSEWILAFIDSRHLDVREVGWRWLMERPEVGRDYQLWQRLTETPYDDVRAKLIELLRFEEESYASSKPMKPITIDARKLSIDRIRFLWATALLNIHRGGKKKPAIVKAIVDRLQHHPEEAAELLPILAVALRSVRSLEWQAGLSGIVNLVEKNPGVSELVGTHFPELNLI